MTQLDQMVAILKEMGPLDAYEIAQEMGICRQNVDTLIRRGRQRGKPRLVYIAKYLVAPDVKKRTKLWMAGDRQDAHKPIYEEKSAKRRHDKKRRDNRKLIARLAQNANNPFGSLIAQVTQ